MRLGVLELCVKMHLRYGQYLLIVVDRSALLRHVCSLSVNGTGCSLPTPRNLSARGLPVARSLTRDTAAHTCWVGCVCCAVYSHSKVRRRDEKRKC